MATDQQAVVSFDTVPDPGTEPATEPVITPQEPLAQPADNSELPEKFRGQSVQQVAKAYSELESLAAKHAGRIGQLEQLIKELQQSQPAAQASVTSDDILDDPAAAIRSQVAREVEPLRQQVAATAEQQFQSTLDAQRPGWREVVSDPRWGEWIAASPVRRAGAQLADRLDVTAAVELIDQYAAADQPNPQAIETARVDAVNEFKRARGVISESASAYRPGPGTIKRSEIQTLAETRPAEFLRRKGEFEAAYRNGLVIEDL